MKKIIRCMPAFLRNNLECWQGGKFGFFDNVEKNWLDGLWRLEIGKTPITQ
jgi:hypothetical protein